MSVTSGTNSGSRPKRQITSGVFTASGINSIRISNSFEVPDAYCGWDFFLDKKMDEPMSAICTPGNLFPNRTATSKQGKCSYQVLSKRIPLSAGFLDRLFSE